LFRRNQFVFTSSNPGFCQVSEPFCLQVLNDSAHSLFLEHVDHSTHQVLIAFFSCDIIGRYFASDAYKADIARDPGKGRDACAYGEDRELWGWMIRASGVDLTQLGGTVESAITLLADNGQREANLLSQPGLLAT
jgi:hypothetical protein